MSFQPEAQRGLAFIPSKRPRHVDRPSAAVVAAAEGAQAGAPEGTASATAPRERVRDPRLPSPGTVIEKRDRQGKVRCKCTVEEDGIRYEGKLYKSLSAAAKDLDLGGKTQNGFAFWGLSKPPRHAADPLDALGRAWDRYRERAASVIGAVTDENREQIRDAIEKHAEAIKDSHREVGGWANERAGIRSGGAPADCRRTGPLPRGAATRRSVCPRTGGDGRCPRSSPPRRPRRRGGRSPPTRTCRPSGGAGPGTRPRNSAQELLALRRPPRYPSLVAPARGAGD